MMWFDVHTRMRPDEYERQNAYRWHEVTVLQNAYHRGYHDAAREKEVDDKVRSEFQA